MKKPFHWHFMLMFAVLGCLLSLAVSGCSDSDRSVDKSVPEVSPSPEVSPEPAKIVSYLFMMSDGADPKVDSEAVEAEVTAYAADGSILEGAELLESSIASMTREDDYYIAEAAVPDEAELLTYTFRHDSEVDGVYAFALTDGVDRYYMSYKDIIEEPDFKVYGDENHQTTKDTFAIGEALYPVATVTSKGGLSIPVTSIVPVDTNVVAYSAADDSADATYEATGEGQTAFTITAAAVEFETALAVTVKQSPVWILPEKYELKNGKIYLNDEQVSDPAEIDTELSILPGGETTCQLITVASGEGADATYELVENEVTAEITSDTAEHFSASVYAGMLTVTVADEAVTNETATIVCTGMGYTCKNELKMTVEQMAWILPETYELKDGKIYLNNEQVSDPAEIDTELSILPGGETTCQLITVASGEGADATYELVKDEVAAEITSDTAEHFNAEVEAGVLTVAIADEVEDSEKATIICTAAQYAFQNQLEVTVPRMMPITIYVPPASYPQLHIPIEVTKKIRIAAIGADDQALEGAYLTEEDITKLLTDDNDCWVLSAVVPETTETVLLLSDFCLPIGDEVIDLITPYFAFRYSNAKDEYEVDFPDFVIPYYYGDMNEKFGTYADEDLTEKSTTFYVGDQIYFYPYLTTVDSGIKLQVSGIKPSNTSIIDENLKCVGAGNTEILGNWYGIEGYVYPYFELIQVIDNRS